MITPVLTPQMIENAILTILSNQPIVDGPTIRNTVRMVVASMPPAGVENIEDFIEITARRLEERLDLTMPDASVVKLKFEPWLESRRSGVEPFYWNRYRMFLQGSGIPPQILGTYDKDTDKIVGLLENPLKPGAWKRRGLVVGHVQSGKTANYIGVISKAADYGYKFIVLLAGMHNNLRRQTQERIEEGFIGLDTDQTSSLKGTEKAWTGVGKIDHSRQPVYGTTRANDFRTAIASSYGISFNTVKEPIILVIKKQKTVLENLTKWIQCNNQASGGTIRNVPMLVIDDESDNASINTRGDQDPTEINRLIRRLLASFEQNCYIGYTATPFANIFIDPDTTSDMLKEDLFPGDFIVSLDAPQNYVGADRVFGDNGDLGNILLEVSDHRDIIPEKHKISLKIDELPDSMLEAIRCFILVRAIRILRGRRHDHNSMLVNVSRFNSVQKQVTGLIAAFLSDLRNSIKAHAELPFSDAIKDPLFNSLHATWEQKYSSAQHEWAHIQAVLNEAIGPISVRTINNKSSDSLDYKTYKNEGLHVIAVGGLSLSRGFTLEGLSISYFLRNSIMYDTLLQMGRWFGYRDGYADICRLYMTSDAISWYQHISDVLDELREEFRLMERELRRPQDFGLKVRSHPDSLIVTARNKMKTGKIVRHSVDLQGNLIETTTLRLDAFRANRDILKSLVDRLDSMKSLSSVQISQGILWGGVPCDSVKQFLSGFRNHDELALKTQIAPLVRYIEARESVNLDIWDICIYSPKDGKSKKTIKLGQHVIHQAFRAGVKNFDYFRVSGKSSRVASRGAEIVGLTAKQIDKARIDFTARSGKNKSISDWYYRQQREKPLLMLHVLDLGDTGDEVCAWGISFPPSPVGADPADSILVEYVVNTVWWRQNYGDDLEDEEEEA